MQLFPFPDKIISKYYSEGNTRFPSPLNPAPPPKEVLIQPFNYTLLRYFSQSKTWICE